MNRIRIMYLINSLKKGGPVNMLYTLVKYMDYSKYEITIMALKDCKEEDKCDFSNIQCNILQLNENNIGPQNLFKIKKVIKSINPHIIHSHGGTADYICSKMSNQYITFSTVHCVPEEDFIMKKGLIFGKIKSAIFYYHLSSIIKPIACSKTVSDKIYNYRGLHIDCVQNGIDYSIIDDYDQKLVLEQPWNKNKDNSIIFVFCGFLSKRKNVNFAIDAFSKVKRQDIKFIILGNGNQYEEILEKSKTDSRIIMIGKVSDAIPYLRQADYFLSSSLSEGLPLAVMEGLACGLPAILSDIDAHRELNELDSTVVKLFDLNNLDSLVNIIENINKDNYNNLSERAIKIIKEKLNSKIMAKNYCTYYDSFLMQNSEDRCI